MGHIIFLVTPFLTDVYNCGPHNSCESVLSKLQLVITVTREVSVICNIIHQIKEF